MRRWPCRGVGEAHQRSIVTDYGADIGVIGWYLRKVSEADIIGGQQKLSLGHAVAPSGFFYSVRRIQRRGTSYCGTT